MKSKILDLLMALLVAFALWLYVITVEHTQTEQVFYNVPVVMDGETVLQDRGLKITSGTDLTVTLKLSGNRSDLNQLRSSDITVLVDLTKIYEAGKKSLSYDVSFPGDIQNSAVEVVTRSPSSIPLEVVEWATKEIPVMIELPGALPEGHIIDNQNIDLEYDRVNIAGPREVVDQIAMAKVLVDMTGRTESAEERVNITLCDGAGVPVEDVSSITPDPYRILVKVPVLMVKDLQLQIPVLEGGGLTADDVKVSMDHLTITVSGSPAVVSKLGDTLTVGTVDLSQEPESFSDREYEIVLPEGVRNTSGVDTVKVSLTLPAMEVKKFDIPMSRFTYENLPEGMAVRFRTQNLSVWIRGRETILDKVDLKDLRVVVDLTGATQNGYYPATVVIENISNVGVVPNPSYPNEPYEVYVAVTAQEPVVPAA